MSRLSTTHLWGLGTVAGLFLSVAACEYRVPTTPPLGYELYDRYCSDGIDNDGDGLIDCDDPECPFTSGWCGEALGEIPPVEQPEDSIYLCSDQVDNDGNGQFDCGDDKCQAIQEACCLREFSDELCSDGLDNDGNGFEDCRDFGCSRGAYVTVCGSTETTVPKSPAEACSDRFDADGDGLVDCDDPDCAGVRVSDAVTCAGAGATLERESELDVCSDGLDNDGDGDIDCDDRDRGDCGRSEVEAVRLLCCPGGTIGGFEGDVATCGDGIDNDCNGFFDCNDFACSGFDAPPEAQAFCEGLEEDDLAECQDGIDNDRDGFLDCNDFSCSDPDRGATPEAAAYCREIGETTFAKCNDGIDNDGNGFTDCADFSCSRPDPADLDEDPTLATACDETGGVDQTAEFARRACSDGLDNDGDGFIDCDDFNCNWNPLLRAEDGTDFCRARRARLVCE